MSVFGVQQSGAHFSGKDCAHFMIEYVTVLYKYIALKECDHFNFLKLCA